MSSESQSESSDSSTGSSSTRPEHIKEVMTALKHNDQKAPALKPYRHAARWIPLGINPFANLMAVLFTGLGEEIELEAEDVIEPSEMALLNLIKMLQDSANRARSDDVAKTNTCIVDYLQPLAPEFLNYDKEEFPLPDRTHLEERGWAHPEYRVLLYPQILLDSFNPTDYTQTMHDAQMGVSLISECEWPGFLYPRGTRFDLEDERLGLFRGYLLPMVFRQIFTGPRTAEGPGSGKKGRASKAKMFNLTSVTPRAIAYTCVIARLALRGRGWTLEDGAFEYGVFYQNIVRMFEDDHEDDWVKETLAWWQEEIPDLPRTAGGRLKKKKKNVSNIKGRIMDPVARSAAQRAAKKAAQNQVDVARGEREEPEVAPGEREQSAPAPEEREESAPAPEEREVADREREVANRERELAIRERELAGRERARPVLEMTVSASIHTAERPQSTPAVDAAINPASSSRLPTPSPSGRQKRKLVADESDLSDVPESPKKTKKRSKNKASDSEKKQKVSKAPPTAKKSRKSH
ncbi:hypothetical protein M413DRAFT_26238 [Hebeloma cylindrosporum]|uniref:Uncharacterized protein n=1 Tax=Hebeloma cylindrosporum TaxID=76867 RepID=A0A0C2YPQ8_HEBCY|nr:hypothetical protein M413DRAFT_26238 [Hebeloma cylindrosporum h7]